MDNNNQGKIQLAVISGLSFLLGFGIQAIIAKQFAIKSQDDQVKEVIRKKYAKYAKQPIQFQQKKGCSSGKCGSSNNKDKKSENNSNNENSAADRNQFSENYNSVQGYNKEADLGLGCGMPTQFALIKKGDIVVDLGCGSGNDSFIARAQTGESGKVIGIDMTPEMIIQAQVNADKQLFFNVEFRLGEIEHMPVLDNFCDVVLSNCALALVPDKQKAYDEMFRILKPKGHFSISDIVVKGKLPMKWRKATQLHVNCVIGALTVEEQLSKMQKAGFVNIEVKKEKIIVVPKETFLKSLEEYEWEDFQKSGIQILSQTYFGEKPEIMEKGKE